MWQYKVLAVSWLCVFWTDADSTTRSYLDSTLLPTRGDEVEATKTYSADSTVRSFFPIKGKQKWMRRGYPPAEEMLFFNVSIINDNEEVSLAELHLHRRRIAKIHGSYRKRFLPLPYRVVLYQVQPNYRHKMNRDTRTMKLASLPVSYTVKSGWHTVDVTAVLRELLINAQGPPELLLGVQFEAPRNIAKTYSPLVPLKHFLKPTDSDHPYRASSYLVVFSEIDPYFEEEESEELPEDHVFKERHLKHKIYKVKSNDVLDEEEPEEMEDEKPKKKNLPSKERKVVKFKETEKEAYKTDYDGHRKSDVVRHKSKYKMNDVKRSKADELALQQKNKLKSLPFLHTNEVEEIRQTSRRLTRSLRTGNASRSAGNDLPGAELKPKEIRRKLNNLIQVAVNSPIRNESIGTGCSKQTIRVRLSDADFGVRLLLADSLAVTHCSGSCSSPGVGCVAASRATLDFGYYDGTGNAKVVQLKNFLATDCGCR